MTPLHWVAASAKFHARSHLAIGAGIAVATAVLVGGLAVGDSVRAGLRQAAELRIGRVTDALIASHGTFGDDLALRIAEHTGGTVAPVLAIQGSASSGDGARRTAPVQILGVDERFWALSPQGTNHAPSLAVNQRFAAELNLQPGDPVILRWERPSLITRDAPLSGTQDTIESQRHIVGTIVPDAAFGRFALGAGQVPPATAFVPLASLQRRMETLGQANVLLSEQPATSALASAWRLGDVGLSVWGTNRFCELRSDRVFIEPTAAAAALALEPSARRVLTYFVNSIRSGSRLTPYSMVSAVDPGTIAAVPDDLAPNEIVLNDWCAQDLNADTGDTIVLTYYVLGQLRRLDERAATFRVRAIIPTVGADYGPDLMPDFPGISDAESCRDWDPGLPINLDAIRDKDETYWDLYRGTPKAFVSREAGVAMWRSERWGDATAIRFPPQAAAPLAAALRDRLQPQNLGLAFEPFRNNALAAAQGPIDFGGLLIAFGTLLILAALALSGLLFVLLVESRASEAGLLRALGFSTQRVLLWRVWEGALPASGGVAAGCILALVYAFATLNVLRSIAPDGAGTLPITFKLSPLNLLAGGALTCLLAFATLTWAARRQARSHPRALLSGLSSDGAMPRALGRPWFLLPACLAGGAVAVSAALPPQEPAGFFGAGALMLAAGLSAVWIWMTGSPADRALPSLAALAHRNVTRFRLRSATVIATLAAGIFLLGGVEAFRKRPARDWQDRASGTGGFALVAESSAPLYADLNDPAVQAELGLDTNQLRGVRIVPFRLAEGDDASCLNLQRAIHPRVLAVRPAELADRNAFAAAWAALDASSTSPTTNAATPALIDANTLQWSLQKSVGDPLLVRDGNNAPWPLRIAGTFPPSILQGAAIVSEQQFLRKHPAAAGYPFFLIDAPADRVDPVLAALNQTLADRGFIAQPTWQRLAQFDAIENRYLSIFQALGGLALLLAAAGTGVVAARNFAERRTEFALMDVLGYASGDVRRCVSIELAYLVGWGWLIGTTAALVATQHRWDAAALLRIASLAALTAAVAWAAGQAGARAALMNRKPSELRAE